MDQDAWRAALLADLAWERALVGARPLRSIFFGGGTPSLMPPTTVAAVIDAATTAFPSEDDLEITLEANPSSVEASRFDDLATAGINRVSLGLQALNDAALIRLGRAHDVAEGLAALDRAQRRFDRVSFDLIYARPGQTGGDWTRELTQALALGTEHLSLYQLTIEPGTRFATEARTGRLIETDEDTAVELWDITQALTGAAGLPAYEISNHARVGAESRHNVATWRGGDYLGIGPGAHGRRAGTATERHRKPENYLSAMTRNGHGVRDSRRLDPGERATEVLLTALRLVEGLALDGVIDGVPLATRIDAAAVERLTRQGFVERLGSILRVTPAGRPVLNAVTAELLI